MCEFLCRMCLMSLGGWLECGVHGLGIPALCMLGPFWCDRTEVDSNWAFLELSIQRAAQVELKWVKARRTQGSLCGGHHSITARAEVGVSQEILGLSLQRTL